MSKIFSTFVISQYHRHPIILFIAKTINSKCPQLSTGRFTSYTLLP